MIVIVFTNITYEIAYSDFEENELISQRPGFVSSVSIITPRIGNFGETAVTTSLDATFEQSLIEIVKADVGKSEFQSCDCNLKFLFTQQNLNEIKKYGDILYLSN